MQLVIAVDAIVKRTSNYVIVVLLFEDLLGNFEYFYVHFMNRTIRT
jgi:hypothetical protein